MTATHTFTAGSYPDRCAFCGRTPDGCLEQKCLTELAETARGDRHYARLYVLGWLMESTELVARALDDGRSAEARQLIRRNAVMISALRTYLASTLVAEAQS